MINSHEVGWDEETNQDTMTDNDDRSPSGGRGAQAMKARGRSCWAGALRSGAQYEGRRWKDLHGLNIQSKEKNWDDAYPESTF